MVVARAPGNALLIAPVLATAQALCKMVESSFARGGGTCDPLAKIIQAGAKNQLFYVLT